MTRLTFLWATCFSCYTLLANFAGAEERPEERRISTAELMDRTGARVKQFWDELSSVACTESLLQEKVDVRGKVVLNNRESFDYLISLHWDGGGLLVDESRLPMVQAQKKAPQGSLLTTQGFAALILVFHPEFQPSYTFTIEGEEENAGRKLSRIHFLPRKGSATPSVLSVKGRNFPIAWEGTAWVDMDLAMVTRLEAFWKEPPEEIGLETLFSEVHYAPMSFKGGKESFWLPDTAKVELKTLHQHWRNTHRFSNYRLFSVESESKIGDIKQEDSKR
jgi:hypothetical protein